jgi:hypothetical protein
MTRALSRALEVWRLYVQDDRRFSGCESRLSCSCWPAVLRRAAAAAIPPASENLCALLGFSGSQPSLNVDCGGSSTSTISNITYDRFGRVVAYEFDIQCTGNSNRYTGRVFNI